MKQKGEIRPSRCGPYCSPLCRIHASGWPTRVSSRSCGQMLGSIASAYKQVPLSDTAFELDAFLVVHNPLSGQPEIYQQKVLPFGSIASVTAFLRCALAIWHLGSVLPAFIWTSYFDDFLSLCDARASKHVEICTSLLFQVLGWKLSEDKLVPYETCCKVLGVELDMTRSPEGVLSICNTEGRREELRDFIQQVLLEGKLPRAEAERLRGRLQFASNYIFGRRFRNCLKELNEHISRGFTQVAPAMEEAFCTLAHLKDVNKPRLVDTRFFEWVHLYVDAAFEPEKHSGVGGLLLSQHGKPLGFFSEIVTPALASKIQRADHKTIIFELEGLAVAIGLSLFRQQIAGKKIVIFTDNSAILPHKV